MTKYIVIELQTNADGAVGNFVYAFDAQPDAEAKWFSVMAAAAKSALPKHACVLMTSEGYLMESRCYDRTQETEGGEE